MTDRRAARAAGSRPGDQGVRRRVPFWVAAAILALTAALLALVAVLAGRAGPLVAHPPTGAPPPLPTATRPAFTVPPPASPTPPQQQSVPSDEWLWWIGAVLAGLVVLLLAAWLVRALRRPSRMAPPPAIPGPAPLDPISFGRLDEDPTSTATDERSFDPHRAADEIIAAWSAVEAVACRLGCARRPASTPTEFLQAATGRFGDPGLAGAASGAILDGGVPGLPPVGGDWTASTVLLRMYHRARFDTAALAPGSARLARAAARALLDRWAAPTPPAGASPQGHPESSGLPRSHR